MARRLEEAAERAEAVGHHRVLAALGVLRSNRGDALQLSEYPDGIDLGAVAAAAGPLPVRAAVFVARQLFEVLAHAHRQVRPVVHGRMTPEAVWVLRAGTLAVDYGLSDPGGKDDTSADTRPLDVRFVHPGWVHEVRARPAHDVYAAAALVWWLLTGSPPRPRLVSPPPSRLRDRCPEAPEELERILLEVLAADQSPPSAAELEHRLDVCFYRSLRAEDHQDGAMVLAERVAGQLPPITDDVLNGTSFGGGWLTAAGKPEDQRVEPSEITPEDAPEGEGDPDLHDSPTVNASAEAPVNGSSAPSGPTVLPDPPSPSHHLPIPAPPHESPNPDREPGDAPHGGDTQPPADPTPPSQDDSGSPQELEPPVAGQRLDWTSLAFFSAAFLVCLLLILVGLRLSGAGDLGGGF